MRRIGDRESPRVAARETAIASTQPKSGSSSSHTDGCALLALRNKFNVTFQERLIGGVGLSGEGRDEAAVSVELQRLRLLEHERSSI